MNFRRWATSTALVGIFVSSAAFAQAEPAQSASEQGIENDEEIVVTGQFLDSGAQSATKLDARALDVPLSVSSYSEKFLDSIEASNVSDLFKYMTGVQRAGRAGVSIVLRGFGSSSNDRNAIMTDGLPGLSGRQSPSTASADHIEVVKGPASILYGQVQPGGFVNIITKKPSARPMTSVEMQFKSGLGSYDRALGATLTVDSTGPITDNVQYRMIGEVGAANTFRKQGDEHPLLLAPSFRAEFGDTTVTVQGEYLRATEQYDSFLVAFNNDIRNLAPIDTSYQEPTDYEKNEGGSGSVSVTQRLGDTFKLNGAFRYVYSDNQVSLFEPVSFRNATTVARRARRQHNVRTFAFGDINLAGKFDVAGIKIKTVIGANYGRETADLDRQQFFNGPASGADSLDLNILNPVIGLARPIETYPLFSNAANLTRRASSTLASGVYFSALLEFSEHFKSMVGLRYAREEISIRELRVPNTPDTRGTNDAWLPMVGLLYQPTRDITFYGSYSTSFSPVQPTAVDINGQYSFKPTRGSSIEGGLKAELFNNKMTVTAAYFDIIKNDTINSRQSAGGTIAEQIGQERSNGFELEVNGQVAPGLQVIGGVSRIYPRITKSNVANQVGAILDNSARTSAQVFTRYDFPDEGPLSGLGLSIGASHTGTRPGILPTATSTDTLPLPAYTTADAAIYYTTGRLALTFKVSNLFDERYFENVGASGATQVQPGAPRFATLTGRVTF